LAQSRDDPDDDRSPYVGRAPPPNNCDSDGEDDRLKLPEDVEELVEEQVDASDDEFAERNSTWIFGVKPRTD
jgi:hypothetical protein